MRLSPPSKSKNSALISKADDLRRSPLKERQGESASTTASGSRTTRDRRTSQDQLESQSKGKSSDNSSNGQKALSSRVETLQNPFTEKLQQLLRAMDPQVNPDPRSRELALIELPEVTHQHALMQTFLEQHKGLPQPSIGALKLPEASSSREAPGKKFSQETRVKRLMESALREKEPEALQRTLLELQAVGHENDRMRAVLEDVGRMVEQKWK